MSLPFSTFQLAIVQSDQPRNMVQTIQDDDSTYTIKLPYRAEIRAAFGHPDRAATERVEASLGARFLCHYAMQQLHIRVDMYPPGPIGHFFCLSSQQRHYTYEFLQFWKWLIEGNLQGKEKICLIGTACDWLHDLHDQTAKDWIEETGRRDPREAPDVSH